MLESTGNDLMSNKNESAVLFQRMPSCLLYTSWTHSGRKSWQFFTPLNKQDNVRTLGILWNNTADSFLFDIKSFPVDSSISKRKILSIIAGIYDPLGLIGPVVFLYKHFMQRLWLCKLGWDEPISGQSLSDWHSLCDKLGLISKIVVPRSIRCKREASTVELHGFSDASERGFGCCIYVRVIYQDSSASCHLLCSKSRVAPLRQVSLPRIELCACLLLSRLVFKVIPALYSFIDNVHLYSDSMVSLYWIHAQSTRWKTYVANRVAEIQRLTQTYTWHHINSRHRCV